MNFKELHNFKNFSSAADVIQDAYAPKSNDVVSVDNESKAIQPVRRPCRK